MFYSVLLGVAGRGGNETNIAMKRAKPNKIFLVLAVMVAGGICLLLPEKSAIPVANMGGTAQNSQNQSDTLAEISFDAIRVR